MRLSKRWHMDVWQEWSAWFRPGAFNWSTFTFVHLYVESTRYRGPGLDGLEIHVGLLGFNVLFEWRYKEIDVDRELARLADQGPAA